MYKGHVKKIKKLYTVTGIYQYNQLHETMNNETPFS